MLPCSSRLLLHRAWRRLVSVGVLLAFAPLATGLGGCGGSTGQNAASQVLKTPELPTDKQTKCRVAKSQAEPLIVEWPDAARGKLESVSRRGLVAVRYEGCELSVLARCTVKSTSGGYGYSPITRKQSSVTIKDADELYANMPVGAVKLESKLQSAGQLNVQMTIVGRYESPTHTVYRNDLEGDCSEATHVVAALTVGSFTFSAGSDAEVGGGVSVAGVAGGGGKSTAKRETIQHDGDETACTKSGTSDKSPPEGCGALLQIEVMPLTKGVRPAVAPVIVPPITPPPTPSPSPTLADSTLPPPPPAPPSTTTKPPKCKRNEHVEDGVCVKGPAPKVAAVKPPTTKPSVASAMPTCAPGQHLYNTRCVDDEPPVPSEPAKPEWTPPPPPPTCLAGTHLENGACVVDPAPPDRPMQPYGSGEQPGTGESVPNPWRLTLAYFAIGAGITSASAGLIALGTAGKAKDECANGACSEKYEDLRKTATTSAIIADVALGIAVLCVVGIFVLPSKKVGIVPTPHGVAMATGWRF
jgi:hypothetical protein